MIKVSIIIPVYNAEKYIKRCLNSVVNQTYQNIEIILINDSSTDKSLDICQEYANNYDNIFLYTKENGGPSSARNYGLTKASGKYCFFCDSDDYIDESLIENLVINKSNHYLNGVNHYVDYENNIISKKYEKNIYKITEFYTNIFNNKILGTVWGFLFKTNIAKKIKFDENTKCMEDTIFLIEYIKQEKVIGIKYLERPLYYYVINKNSITNAKNNINIIINYVYSLNKINNILNLKYNKIINDEIIRIVENHLSDYSIKEYNKIKEINIPKQYFGKSCRYKIFTQIFNNHSKYLTVYYKIINILKLIKSTLKRGQ